MRKSERRDSESRLQDEFRDRLEFLENHRRIVSASHGIGKVTVGDRLRDIAYRFPRNIAVVATMESSYVSGFPTAASPEEAQRSIDDLLEATKELRELN